jgi:hypothetical protein
MNVIMKDGKSFHNLYPLKYMTAIIVHCIYDNHMIIREVWKIIVHSNTIRYIGIIELI